MAGGVSGFSSRFDNAEVLVKGDTTWREITARLPVGSVNGFSGVNINNKVYFIGNIQTICLINIHTYMCNCFIIQVDQLLQTTLSSKFLTI